jgi:hypothetical protein
MFGNDINKLNEKSEENKVDKTKGLLGTALLAIHNFLNSHLLCKNIRIKINKAQFHLMSCIRSQLCLS